MPGKDFANLAKAFLIMRNVKRHILTETTENRDNKKLNKLLTRTEEKAIFCLLDIDNFSLYNLTNSFENGNIALERIYNLIMQLPALSNLTKLGSDEFIFSCIGDFEQNKASIFSLLQTIQNNLNFTVCIGITEPICMNFSLEKLLHRLKSNVMTAKANGKNKIYID